MSKLMFEALATSVEPLQSSGSGIAGAIVWFIGLVILLVTLIGQWITFQKAKQPGWAAIIPIFNSYVMLKIGNNAWWWLLIIIFVPVVNIIGFYKMHAGVARAFGHGAGFALGLWFLPFIFWPILGFGDEQYQGPPGGSSKHPRTTV